MVSIDHERLKKLRKEKFSTLSKAARASGVNVSHLSDIEHGKCVPKIETLYRLIEAYGWALEIRVTREHGSSELIHRLFFTEEKP